MSKYIKLYIHLSFSFEVYLLLRVKLDTPPFTFFHFFFFVSNFSTADKSLFIRRKPTQRILNQIDTFIYLIIYLCVRSLRPNFYFFSFLFLIFFFFLEYTVSCHDKEYNIHTIILIYVLSWFILRKPTQGLIKSRRPILQLTAPVHALSGRIIKYEYMCINIFILRKPT